MFVSCHKDHIRMRFSYLLDFMEHIGIVKVSQILRSTEYTAGDGINGSKNRKRYIQTLFHVCQWENMLLKSKQTTMYTVTAHWMVGSYNNKFFIISSNKIT